MVLEAIRNLPTSFQVKTFTVMAGAIDDTCLSDEYKDAATRIGKISVLASNCDEVLKRAFPVGNLVAGMVTRGDPYWHGALGQFGPNPPDQPSSLWKTPILPDRWNFGHGSYLNCAGPYVGPPPLAVPSQGTPAPANSVNWQQAWAAGLVSARFA